MAGLIINTTTQLQSATGGGGGATGAGGYAGVTLGNGGFFTSSCQEFGATSNGSSVLATSLSTGCMHVIGYTQGTSTNNTCGFSHAFVFNNGSVGLFSAISLATTAGLTISVSTPSGVSDVYFQNTSTDPTARNIYQNTMLLTQ